MELVIYIGAALLFLALVMASIGLHEAGHWLVGRIFGVKTTEFFVGFGKTLWSFRRGETEYGVKAIPLGGYVRFVGMVPPAKSDPDGTARSASTGMFSSMIESARQAEWEEITPADEGRLFYQKKPWQQLLIMAAGPVMNLVLAFLILQIMFLTLGVGQQTTTVERVDECVVPVSQATRVCTDTTPKTPAFQLGLQKGDQIIGFNAAAVGSWEQMTQKIRANLDRPATVTVIRGGQELTLGPVNTAINQVTDDWDPAKTVPAGFLGVATSREVVRGGPLFTLSQMWTYTKQSLVVLSQFPVRVFNVAADVVTGQPRDQNSPMSIVGASRVAGEIATTDQLDDPNRIAAVAGLLASVNLFVGLLNFLPLPPLDGGRMVGALYEWARRGISRVFKVPSGGYFDTAKLMPLTYLVGGFMLICGVVLIVADIISPLRLFG